jgi:hypothetical protein
MKVFAVQNNIQNTIHLIVLCTKLYFRVFFVEITFELMIEALFNQPFVIFFLGTGADS